MAKKLLSVVATAGLTAIALTQANPALALVIGDNVKPAVSDSGAANCNGGDACVEKIGDVAEVSWTVQVSPLLVSADSSLDSMRAKIAIPDVVENLRVETVSLPNSDERLVEGSSDEGNFASSVPVTEVSREVTLLPYNGTPDDQLPVTPSFDSDPAEWSAVLYQPEWGDGALTEASYNPNLGGVTEQGATDFQIVELRALDYGVTTLKVSGEVTVQSEDTYLPVRVDVLTSAYEWGEVVTLEAASRNTISTNIAYPEYSLTDAEVNANIAALQHSDGRLGNAQCLPTSETSRLDTIGTDSTNEDGSILTGGLKDVLILSPSSQYLLAAFDTQEDGCDQADFHITICETVEPDDTTVTEPETDEPETPEVPVTDEPETESDDVAEPQPERTETAPTVDTETAAPEALAKTGLSIAGLSVAAILLIAGGMVAARGTRQEA